MNANLPCDVPFFHPMHLSLPNHVHALVALQCPACGLEGKEPHPWLNHPLDEAMVLLDQVVEVFDQALV
jgi:hypothetical protein